MKMYDDDGTEIFEYEIPKPSLCLTCSHDNDPELEIICNLNRFDQQEEPDFECDSYCQDS